MSLTNDDIKILQKMFEENNTVLENRLEAKLDAKLNSKIDSLESRIDTKLAALESRMELKMEYMLKGMRMGIMSEIRDIIDQRFDALYAFLNNQFDKFVLKSEIKPEFLKSS